MLSIYRKTLLSLILLVVILTLSLNSHAQFFSPFEIERLIGKEAPDFIATDLSGDEVVFSSFRGKPVLLNFWATWCPYCREERPQLNSIYKEYKDRGLIVVAISVDRSVNVVRRFLRRMPADFIILHDNNREAAERYGVFSLPTSFLIDRNGIVRNKFIGPNWTDTKKRLIEELIKIK
jgi:DsbE subfamily thiol:disulfide oxidoreductase